MKKIIVVLAAFLFFSCKKDSAGWITATVVKQGCYPNSWIVKINNPNPQKQTFLCDPMQAMASSSTTNCGNTAVILDLPVELAQADKQIKFSRWKDKGLLCFSSTLAPHHLEGTDISAK